MTPEQPVEDAVEEAVEVEALYVRLPPDPLQCRADVGTDNVQHLSDTEKGGRKSERAVNQTCDNEGNEQSETKGDRIFN